MDDIIEQEKQKRRSELDVLQAQINPHFLYNTLDSVVWMTENGRTEDAVVMLTSLARFFRISLSRGSSVIPIADELEHARHYLTIQKMRYKNKFSADIQAEDGVEQLYTIKLVIQPLIFLPVAAWMGFRGEQMIAILIMLASPTTPSCYIMAKNMDNDGVLTASVIVMTTLLAAFTLTGWIFILKTVGLIG